MQFKLHKAYVTRKTPRRMLGECLGECFGEHFGERSREYLVERLVEYIRQRLGECFGEHLVICSRFVLRENISCFSRKAFSVYDELKKDTGQPIIVNHIFSEILHKGVML